MPYNEEAMLEALKGATTDQLERSLIILSKQTTDDSRLREVAIKKELKKRADADTETNKLS
jgi:hypothetical protein